jgi:hypothetical protein
VDLVPLDLIGDQGGDDVVDIRCAGNVHRQNAFTVGTVAKMPLATTGRGLDGHPILEADAECLGEVLR